MFQNFSQFEARSGRIVKAGEDGTLVFDHVNGYLTPESAMDAEEFFQAKGDKDLGRWRWPENPHIVVYPTPSGGTALNEATGETGTWTREWAQLNQRENIGADAVAAYFEAHPNKPWRRARHRGGRPEVWALTLLGESGETAFIVDGNRFESGPRSLPIEDPAILSGRRIWPEDAS